MAEELKTILVVDAESHIRRLIEFTLKKGNYKMLVATNGREAVDIATASSPNLIIMDVLMPEMDGIEALDLLKQDERTSSIPVILLTGIGQSTTKQEVEEKGAATYLAKPFSPNKLLREVQRMI
jgi:CheY-like chemotaxis protein